MNAQQAENLRILIRHMETKVSRQLEMNSKFMEPQDFDGECGTPACALGEAAFCDGLAHLTIPRVWGRLFTDRHGHLFVDYCDTLRLFGGQETNRWKRNDVTPQEWAAEARKVLAENGYAMEDTWAADKVREVTKPCDAIVCDDIAERMYDFAVEKLKPQ